MQWIALSFRPLTLHELAESIIVNTEEPYLDLDERLFDANDILDILPAGLVRVTSIRPSILPSSSYQNDNNLQNFSGDSDNESNSSNQDSIVCNQGSIHHDYGSDDNLQNFEDDSVCHSIAESNSSIQNSIVHKEEKWITFAHFSVLEYLMSNRIRTDLHARYQIEHLQGNNTITKACFAYLLGVSETYTSAFGELEPALDDKFPLLNYSFEGWHFHGFSSRTAARTD